MTVFLEGVVGQEILKTCTGKFIFWRLREALGNLDVPLTRYVPQKCRYGRYCGI